MKTPEQIEKLADEKYLEKVEDINNSTIRGFIVSAVKGGFVEGYQQCQEYMADKKYTEEDVIKAINLARKTIVNKWGVNGEESIDFAYSNTKIMQSINKQD